MSDVLNLSVTPEDAGCQQLLSERLSRSGFDCKQMDFEEVKNLWACHGDTDSGPLLVFLGHTDVVPPGPLDEWQSPPFNPEIRDDYLYGRGAADMKASVAAMVVALEQWVAEHPQHRGQVALLLTSDEEGPALNGVRQVIPALSDTGVEIDYCIVGEPSSLKLLGDNVRIGRRGSLNAELKILGVQGHAAYPELAENPIHRFSQALSDLCKKQWDQGNAHFPPTSMQFSNIQSGAGASNIIPGDLFAKFNFRYSPESEADELQKQVEHILDEHGLTYELDWQLSGEPFYTENGAFSQAVGEVVERVCNLHPVFDTGGGTSDGRFVAPTGAQVIEVGPVNDTIHKINERVLVSDIEKLVSIYQGIAEKLLS